MRGWIAAGAMVVCDRYLASSIAYGEAQGLDPAWLRDDPAPPAAAVADAAARHPAGGLAAAQAARRATSSSATCRCWRACATAICARRQAAGLGAHRRRSRTRTPWRGGAQRGPVTTRAAVSARTSRDARASSTRAHASSVAPVVATSSTSTTPVREGDAAWRPRDAPRHAGLRGRGRTPRARCGGAASAGRSTCGGVDRTRAGAAMTGRPRPAARASA